jgi:hypothetical protein
MAGLTMVSNTQSWDCLQMSIFAQEVLADASFLAGD